MINQVFTVFSQIARECILAVIRPDGPCREDDDANGGERSWRRGLRLV